MPLPSNTSVDLTAVTYTAHPLHDLTDSELDLHRLVPIAPTFQKRGFKSRNDPPSKDNLITYRKASNYSDGMRKKLVKDTNEKLDKLLGEGKVLEARLTAEKARRLHDGLVFVHFDRTYKRAKLGVMKSFLKQFDIDLKAVPGDTRPVTNSALAERLFDAQKHAQKLLANKDQMIPHDLRVGLESLFKKV